MKIFFATAFTTIYLLTPTVHAEYRMSPEGTEMIAPDVYARTPVVNFMRKTNTTQRVLGLYDRFMRSKEKSPGTNAVYDDCIDIFIKISPEAPPCITQMNMNRETEDQSSCSDEHLHNSVPRQ